MDISHRFVDANGIRMHIAEAGVGPIVVLAHGFPETWYSWRQQLVALADAGFHAIAPDQRGYGETDKPEAIDSYTMLHLVGDLVGLLDAVGTQTAAIVGHDWGAPVAWNAAATAGSVYCSCHSERSIPSAKSSASDLGDGEDGHRGLLPALLPRAGCCRSKF